MTISLEELLQAAEQQARSVLIGTKKQLAPAFVLVKPNNDVEVVVRAWDNDIEKNIVVATVRKYMRETGTIAYSFVTEAWMAVQPKEWDPKKDPIGLRPSQRPDRVEVVIALATDGVNTLYRQWEMKRDRAGRCIELTLQSSFTEGTSWLANLLGGTA